MNNAVLSYELITINIYLFLSDFILFFTKTLLSRVIDTAPKKVHQGKNIKKIK